jgi:hypothetical protein
MAVNDADLWTNPTPPAPPPLLPPLPRQPPIAYQTPETDQAELALGHHAAHRANRRLAHTQY